MPLRELECYNCFAIFDKLNPERGKVICPYCGSKDVMQKEFSTFSWQFRGLLELIEEEEKEEANADRY